MQVIIPAELLQLWEAGSEQTLLERSLLLLAKSFPQHNPTSLAMLSIGERDDMLLSVREYLFGNKLKNTSACSKCAEIVEWESDTRHMHLQPAAILPAASAYEFIKGDITIKYRLPNSNDLMKIDRRPVQYHTNSNQLLEDCIIEIQKNNKHIALNEVDAAILDDVDLQISKCDPQADIHIKLSCPSCKNEWEANFDIISYLWAEIDVWATHLLHEVYLLASAFRWAETDIINMSQKKRTMYVKLIQE